MCESKELIVGYVYDELTRDERAVLERHLGECPECLVEVAELRQTRGHLSQWAPPEPDLGFRVISGGSAPAQALPRRSRFVPAFAYAAAAVIVLATAAAIANLEVRYGGEGLVVRTGWARGAEAPAQNAGALPQGQAVPASASADLAVLDRRLREIESTLATSGTAASAGEPGMSDAEMLRRVRQIVADAEARQQTAVTERLVAVVRDFERQRRTEMAILQQGLGQYQGLTNAEIAQNRDMLNQLVRAATRQEKE